MSAGKEADDPVPSEVTYTSHQSLNFFEPLKVDSTVESELIETCLPETQISPQARQVTFNITSRYPIRLSDTYLKLKYQVFKTTSPNTEYNLLEDHDYISLKPFLLENIFKSATVYLNQQEISYMRNPNVVALFNRNVLSPPDAARIDNPIISSSFATDFNLDRANLAQDSADNININTHVQLNPSNYFNRCRNYLLNKRNIDKILYIKLDFFSLFDQHNTILPPNTLLTIKLQINDDRNLLYTDKNLQMRAVLDKIFQLTQLRQEFDDKKDAWDNIIENYITDLNQNTVVTQAGEPSFIPGIVNLPAGAANAPQIGAANYATTTNIDFDHPELLRRQYVRLEYEANQLAIDTINNTIIPFDQLYDKHWNESQAGTSYSQSFIQYSFIPLQTRLFYTTLKVPSQTLVNISRAMQKKPVQLTLPRHISVNSIFCQQGATEIQLLNPLAQIQAPQQVFGFFCSIQSYDPMSINDMNILPVDNIRVKSFSYQCGNQRYPSIQFDQIDDDLQRFHYLKQIIGQLYTTGSKEISKYDYSSYKKYNIYGIRLAPITYNNQIITSSLDNQNQSLLVELAEKLPENVMLVLIGINTLSISIDHQGQVKGTFY